MKVEFTQTRSDYKSASRIIFKLHPRSSWVRIVNFWGSFIGTFIATISLIIVIKTLPDLLWQKPGFVFSLGTLAIGICIFISTRFYVKRIFLNKAGIYGSLITFELLDDRLRSWINNKIKIDIYPAAIKKVMENSGFILIYTAEAYAYYIPTYAFNTEVERNDFLIKIQNIKK